MQAEDPVGIIYRQMVFESSSENLELHREEVPAPLWLVKYSY